MHQWQRYVLPQHLATAMLVRGESLPKRANLTEGRLILFIGDAFWLLACGHCRGRCRGGLFLQDPATPLGLPHR